MKHPVYRDGVATVLSISLEQIQCPSRPRSGIAGGHYVGDNEPGQTVEDKITLHRLTCESIAGRVQRFLAIFLHRRFDVLLKLS